MPFCQVNRPLFIAGRAVPGVAIMRSALGRMRMTDVGLVLMTLIYQGTNEDLPSHFEHDAKIDNSPFFWYAASDRVIPL